MGLVWLFLVLLSNHGLAETDPFHGNIQSADSIRLIKATSNLKATADSAEHTKEFWYEKSFSLIEEHMSVTVNNNKAKNVIMFLGDGMSIATVTAARIYKGQLENMTGEEQRLSWEMLPYTGLSKTYCVNSQVADSACSATAYLTGVKGNIKTIGVTAEVAYQDWEGMLNSSLYTTSIAQWAQDAGKGTGFVTTCTVVDASPTGLYGHTASRYYQTDADLPTASAGSGLQDIATQLIKNEPGMNFKVIMGGGRTSFLNTTMTDGYGNAGLRTDGQNLTNVWMETVNNRSANGSYITDRDGLLNLDINNTDYVLGLFAPVHLEYYLNANQSLQPTLAEMTSVAIQMMQKEENGYFLFIEGGQIDHGHHSSKPHVALSEAHEFHKAIQLAMNMTSEDDTLILVTADHAHTMTINGYPARGSDIFTTLQSTDDNLTYSTLSYATGPGVITFNSTTGKAHDISEDDLSDIDYAFPSPFYLSSETHDGQDVGVWARGPRAHLLVGNYEQTVIAHVMGYALGVGPAAEAFNTSYSTSSTATSTPSTSTSTPTPNTTPTSDSHRPIPLMTLWTTMLVLVSIFSY